MIAAPSAPSFALQITGDAPATTGDATPHTEKPFAALLAMLGISVEKDVPATPEASISEEPDARSDDDAPPASLDETKLEEAISSGLAAVLALSARPDAARAEANSVTSPIIASRATVSAPTPFAPPTVKLDPAPAPTPPIQATPASLAMIIQTALGAALKESPPPTPVDAAPGDGTGTPDADTAASVAVPLAAAPNLQTLSDPAPAITSPDAATFQPLTRTEAPASPQNQSAPAEIGIQQQLDLAHDGAWLDRLARDIARTANHDAQLRFQLNPEHLGSLRVELSAGAEGTAIRLTADTDAARAILSDAQPRLLAEARAQGLKVSEAHVDLGGQGGHQRREAQDQQPFIRTPLAAEPATESPRTAAERDA
jgi:hypothetical protein